jgi:hypothetical protein
MRLLSRYITVTDVGGAIAMDSLTVSIKPITIIGDERRYDTLKKFVLLQNYPNPFNPSTKIKFALPKPEIVTIEIYNIIGQKIITLLNKPMPAGYHEVEFNG